MSKETGSGFFESMIPLGDVGEWLSGGTPDTRYPSYWDGDTPWISAASLKAFDVFESDRRLTRLGVMAAGRLAPPGSVVFVVRGMSLANEFRVGVARIPVAFGQDCKVIIPRDDVDGRFLAYFLLSKSNHFVRTAEASGHGTKRLVTRFIAEVKMPKLSLSEQGEIVDILDAVDDAVKVSSDYIKKLNLMKDGLVSDLFFRPGQGFQCASLGDVIHYAEYGVSSPLYYGPGTPVLRMGNIASGEFLLDDLKSSLSDVPGELLLSPGDLLFNRTNSMDKVGKSAVWRGAPGSHGFASYLVRLKYDPHKMDGEYLNFYLNSSEAQKAVRVFSTPAIQQVNINPTNMQRMQVSFPVDLEEQRRIVSIVRAHDERIAVEKVRLAKLRKLKAGLMNDLMTGRVRVDQLDELPV